MTYIMCPNERTHLNATELLCFAHRKQSKKFLSPEWLKNFLQRFTKTLPARKSLHQKTVTTRQNKFCRRTLRQNFCLQKLRRGYRPSRFVLPPRSSNQSFRGRRRTIAQSKILKAGYLKIFVKFSCADTFQSTLKNLCADYKFLQGICQVQIAIFF